MSVYERATEAVLPEEQYNVCHVTITLLSCDFIFYRCSVIYSSMCLRCFEQNENIKYFTFTPHYPLFSQMPRVWMDYCQFLTEQNKITRTRQTFDRSLRSLPLTQHKRIWPLYIKFLRQHNIPETAVRALSPPPLSLLYGKLEDYAEAVLPEE